MVASNQYPAADRNIRLEDVAKLPELATRPSYTTLWRWCTVGRLSRGGRRIFLRHVKEGRTVCTRPSWLREFFEALASTNATPAQSPSRPMAKRLADADAESILISQGL